MSIARSLPSRCLRQLRLSRPALRGSRVQRPARRGYATASETAKDTANKAKETAGKAADAAKQGLTSDMPWLITSIAVTVPGTYLLLSSGKVQNPFSYPLPGSHHHGEHDEEHDEEHEEEHEDHEEAAAEVEGEEEQTPDEHKGGEDEKPAAGGDDSEGDDSDKRADTTTKPGAKEGKGLSEVPDDNKLSMKTADGGDAKFDEKQELESDGDSKVLHMPDAKGGAKRRIESGNSIKLGEEDDIEGQGTADKAAPSKEPVAGSTSGKQAGLSNTDTKHSTPVDEMNTKSTKAEGGPETAKAQGTVDPGKPLK